MSPLPPELEELLRRGLSELGLSAAPDLQDRLGRYLASIEAWNPAYGLVGASGSELVIKHALDSLAPLAVLDRCGEALAAARTKGRAAPGDRRAAGGAQQPLRLADLGTGAGLPGIPLALARPAWEVSLVDRMTRRIRFLEAMRAELPLPNVDIIEEQVEHAKGRWDILTFRAFRPFERKLFKKVFCLCAPDGYVAAYKGKAEKARAELSEIEGLYSHAEILPLGVPFLEDERCLVLLRPAPRG